MTLADFLLARIAEDEEVARSVRMDEHLSTRDGSSLMTGQAGVYATVSINSGRVLAECEAKRRIVEALVDAEQAVAGYDNDDPNNPPSYWQEWGNRHAWREACELLALPYADHPDYREEWRP